MDPRHIVRQGYDKVSHAYRSDTQTTGGDLYSKWTARLVADLGVRPRILDLGCGCGIPTARALAGHGSVVGVDISPIQIARARELVPDAEFLCEDMTSLEFQAETFDAIVSFYAIIHVPLEDQQQLLKRIASWLKPGGVFVATLGSGAWTGTEQDWLGVAGAEMYWSHADAATYRAWFAAAGLSIQYDEYIPEENVNTGHQLFYAKRDA